MPLEPTKHPELYEDYDFTEVDETEMFKQMKALGISPDFIASDLEKRARYAAFLDEDTK